MTDTALVQSVARGLRYRPLGHLVRRSVEIADLAAVEVAVRLALGPDFPDGCRLAGPELPYREGGVAKYGILDLKFSAPAALLDGHVLTGVPLLRDLGFLPGGEVGPQHRVCDDPTCLEMLQEELSSGQTWLLLLLEGGRPGEGRRVGGATSQVHPHVPVGYLPRRFRVLDACAANAAAVWLWKHFYL